MSPTLFFIYINDFLSETEKCQQVDVKYSENRMSGLLFAVDFVGLGETGTALQRLVNGVYNYCKRWHFEANIKISAVVIFL